MRRRVASILATGAAAALALGLSATSASAQQEEWVVDPAGPYEAASGETTLTNTSNGVQLICASSEASGELAASATGSPAQVGTVDAISFTSCSGPLGITFDVQPANLPWSINGISETGGVTQGYIGGITANLVGPSCSATVEGAADGTFTNSTDVLALGPDDATPEELVVTSVDPNSNCFGLISEGNVVTYEADYAVTPGQDITGPPAG